MLGDEEKRSFRRMKIEYPARFTVRGKMDVQGAIVKDLSAGGVLLWIDQEVRPGTRLWLNIEPPSNITPPLNAEVEVLRCTLLPDDEGSFAVAGQIREFVKETI